MFIYEYFNKHSFQTFMTLKISKSSQKYFDLTKNSLYSHKTKERKVNLRKIKSTLFIIQISI